MKINSINQLNNIKLGLLDRDSDQTLENNISFSAFLKNSIDKVNTLQKESAEYDLKIASGQLENIHEAMIAAEKADVALQLTIQIRNKVLDAYREIMRMQI